MEPEDKINESIRSARPKSLSSGSSVCSCGAWDQEYSDLIIEINELNADIFTLKDFPDRMRREVNERYKEATKKRREAEAKIEDWERDSATDANYAYWEGQCHALAAIKRAMVI